MGTFDVSVLTIENEVFEVLSTSGNTMLGGEDFDSRIVDHLIEEFKRKNKKDIRGNNRAVRRLRTAAERAKRTLSSATQASIEIDSLYEGVDFYTSITRARFEELCSDLFRSTLDSVEKALKDAKLDKGSIDEIVLVGGSSRIPKVQKLLSEYFNGKQLCSSVNPDEAVAYGAAIQAASLTGNKEGKLKDLLLIDVCPLSLGIVVQGKYSEKIIERNTTIPTTKKKTFTNAADGQTMVEISVCEGERVEARENRHLGAFMIEGLPAGKPRGSMQIEVEFSLDANSILKVSAKELTSGVNKSITIKNDKGNLTREEIDAMVKEAEKYAEHDKKIRDQVDAFNNCESFLYNIKQSLDKVENKEEVEAYVTEKLQWMEQNREASKEELDAKLKEFQDYWYPIASKMYQGGDVPTAPTDEPTVSEVD